MFVDNNSIDQTFANASSAGATVLTENKKGYGYACLRAMKYVAEQSKAPDIIVFIDGDYSDYPHELEILVKPILEDKIDLVIGARVKHFREAGSMTPQQIFGNWLATSLMKLLFGGNIYRPWAV